MATRLLIVTLFFSTQAFGQKEVLGRYVKKDADSYRHLILKPDSTFEYIDNSTSFHDTAIGKFQTLLDTIYLGSFSQCTDTTLLKFINLGVSPRPSCLLIREDKLYLVDNGIVRDSKDQLANNYKPPKGWRHVYRRKYFLFGPYVRKTKYTYYLQKDNAN